MIKGLINEFSSKCDYLDLRIHEIIKEAVILENSETNNMYFDNKSFGVRALLNGGWGLAFSHNFNDLRSIFEKALKNAKLASSKHQSFNPPPSISDSKKFNYEIDPFTIEPIEKIKLLKQFESRFNQEPRVKNSNLLLLNERVKKSVHAPGINLSQEFTINSFKASVTAREGDLIQGVNKSFSRLGGYETITSLSINDLCNELLTKVNQLLDAPAPKPERAAVVCDPQLTGLFFHEAVGHACEADAVLNNASVFNDKLGQQIANEEVNLIDDPTIPERGFYWYDDEGIKATPTPLITNGILTGFMHSLSTANEMGVEPTGNGRSMNAESLPIPRMSNTVLKPGERSVEELIKEAGNGYYAKGFTGGVVNPITGEFTFGAQECFTITNGEVEEPLRDVTLAGNILNSLKQVMVGRDATKTRLSGTCGKLNQHIRVGDLCPSILVKGVIVGGSA